MIWFRRNVSPYVYAAFGNKALRFGYSIQIRMALTIDRFNGRVSSFDRGQEYDYRTVEFVLSLTKEEMHEMTKFLDFRLAAVDEYFQLFASSDNGFFVAGPDFPPPESGGGGYGMTLLDNGYSSMKLDHFGNYECRLRVLLYGLPTPPPVPPQPNSNWPRKSFEIGSVAGLRDPKIAPKQEIAATRGVSLGGQPTVIRRLTDEATTTLSISDTTQSMARIVSYLQQVRGGTFMLRGCDNFWPFGGARDVNPGEWPVRLLDNTITLVHNTWDTWTMSLKLWNAEAAND